MKPQAVVPPDILGEPSEIKIGDVDKALKEADASIDHVYRAPRYNHNAIEPHATIAVWDDRGGVAVFDATQSVNLTAHTLSYIFDLKVEDVRVVAPFLGGGFGGKLGWSNTALCVAAPFCLAPAATAQQTLAQQTVTFLCAAPAGHVCQFAVQTGGSQIAFALPSGERKEVPGITPHADKYCVCDPGPVTADCTAPRLDHWCLGSWLDVDSGLNSKNDANKDLFVTASSAAVGGRTTRAP